MTKPERDKLTLRMVRIELQLQALAEGRLVDGNPAEVEQALLAEQDEIEHRLGVDWFARLPVMGPFEGNLFR